MSKRSEKAEIYEKIELDFNEAMRLRSAGKSKEALFALNSLIEKHSNVAILHGVIASIYYDELQDITNALRHFELAVKYAPRSKVASLGLFHALLDNGERKKAICELERFLKLKNSPEHIELLTNLQH